MSAKEIKGHYIKQKEHLIRDLEDTCGLVEGWLIYRYGQESAAKLKHTVLHEFEKLIPEIPYIEGFRAKLLNTFLNITAQELAVYKGMKKHGKSVEEAWEACHEALIAKCARIPEWKRWLLKVFMFSPLVKSVFQYRARKKENGLFGNFEMEYLVGRGDDFDIGVNYLQCGNLDFVKTHGGEEFAPFICLSDIALSDAMGWGLIRTQTLADGCSHCDFRFKKGAKTQISSKTPEVQKTIEKISSVLS